MTIQPGTRLGPYEIVASIGAGGMGEVWRGRDTRLDRDVAIKVLPPGFAENEQLLQRFEREAKAISQLNHPHVCTLFDVGHQSAEPSTSPLPSGRGVGGEGVEQDTDTPSPGASGATLSPRGEGKGNALHYLVMEYLEGESLADRIKKGPLPLHEVLKCGQQIASALDAAHRQGITHRDLKPGNIMLTKSGAKLLDFGLAKTATDTPAPIDGLTNLPTEAKPLTTEGTILGTFQYMAPEQLEGLEADARTDIFALGAVLYEMATGHRAFNGGTKTSLIAAIVSSQPAPISSVVAMTPPALDHVVRRCLEKDPDDRWQSAHDVASEIQWISEAGSQAGVAAPVTVRRKTRERLAWFLASVFFVAAVAMSWFAVHWKRTVDDQPSVRASILPPDDTTFGFTDVDSGSLVLSPDGSQLLFSATSKDGGRMLYVRPIGSTSARPLAGTERATFPFWSPDGKMIAFGADRKLSKIDANGGELLTICESDDTRGGSWGPDGTIVFSSNSLGGLYKVPATGGTPVPVTTLEESDPYSSHRHPFFLPDGKHFLFTAIGGFSGGGEGDVLVGSLDSKEPKLVVKARSKAVYSQGHLLFVKNNVLMAQPFDDSMLELTGEAVPIGERVLYTPELANGVFTASANGVLAYFSLDISQLVLRRVNPDGEEIATISMPDYFNAIRLSPDGTRLAVTVIDQMQSGSDIWILDLVTGSKTRLTFDEHGTDPVWSPDGLRIAYATSGSSPGTTDIAVRDATGGGARELLLSTDAGEVPWDWSPDGTTILFNRASGPDLDFWALPLDGGDPFPVVTGTATQGWGVFSPDGRWIAYLSNETGRWQAYATQFPDLSGKWQLTSDTDGAYWIVGWVNGGKDLVHITSTQMLSVLSLKPGPDSIEVGLRKRIARIEGERTWAASADGSFYVIATAKNGAREQPITLVTNWLAARK